ncbi:hypothetical protein FHG87_010415 [Trinorchestia longiramus]|nr:hypothetical protein FHG87_010415 [Trinorchestia longiramus]
MFYVGQDSRSLSGQRVCSRAEVLCSSGLLHSVLIGLTFHWCGVLVVQRIKIIKNLSGYFDGILLPSRPSTL